MFHTEIVDILKGIVVKLVTLISGEEVLQHTYCFLCHTQISCLILHCVASCVGALKEGLWLASGVHLPESWTLPKEVALRSFHDYVVLWHILARRRGFISIV